MTNTEQHNTRVAKRSGGAFVVICDVCGQVGRPEFEGDAEAIAERHTQLGGFEKPSGYITCERCGRSTTDPDLWDPEVDTGRIFCDRCWDHRDEPIEAGR